MVAVDTKKKRLFLKKSWLKTTKVENMRLVPEVHARRDI